LPSSSQAEHARLSALSKCRILDTEEDEAFDQFTRLAAQLCACPMAMIAFVDRERVWLKSALGLSLRTFARRHAPCDAALGSALLSIEDASRDERFAAHPLVAQPPGVRFYAAARLHSPEGEPIGALAIMDVAPRKLGEREAQALRTLAENVSAQVELRVLRDPRLLRTEALLRAAHRIAGIGSWQWDMRSNELTWSAEMFTIFNRPRSHLPTLDDFMERVHPEDRAAVQERTAETLRGVRTRYPDYRVQWPDKTVRIVAATAELERDHEGKPIRLTGALQDVTEQRRSEVERQQLAIQMLRAQKLESLGLLAAGVAHDFNNLLVGLLGNAELALEDARLPSRPRQHIEQAIDAGSQAAALTRQLLAYTGRGPVSICKVDLDAHVRGLSSLLRASLPKTINLSCELAPRLPDIHADPDQLQQVTMNLILNAAEAYGSGGEGEVRIRTLLEVVEQPEEVEQLAAHGFSAPGQLLPGSYVVFEVSDAGCGIPADTLERIFEPFYSTKFTGRGLGLAAVLGIVRGHGAFLSVDSEPRVGTTFRVYFPVAGAELTGEITELGG
jgi:signal transduction histidine kinase